MKTSDNGIKLIKRYEGCRLVAYKCAAGVWTIGYGHTSGVKQGQSISQAKAVEYLKSDLAKFEKSVNTVVKVPITQNMFDALISFTYNLGSGALAKSTLLKLINNEEYSKAALEFEKWVKAGDKVLSGLVKRRNAEKKMYLKNMYIVPDKKVSKNSCKLEIIWLQHQLGTVEDGVYGPKTRQALLAYWDSIGWNKEGKSDGWTAGEKTLNRMKA